MTAYNEDTIVRLITELYHLHIRLCTIEDEEVAWPPVGGHRINVELCKSLHLDDTVISLLKRLPYLKDLEKQLYFCLFPGGFPYVYTYDRDLRSGRDPQWNDFNDEAFRPDWLLPHDFAFTFRNGLYGSSTILDTKENTIRVCCFQEGPQEWKLPGDYKLERPDDMWHYRNYFSQDATAFLSTLVDQVKKLENIPSNYYPNYDFYDSKSHPIIQGEMKKTIESYGWPDQFRREEFKSNMEEHWENAEEEDADEQMRRVGDS